MHLVLFSVLAICIAATNGQLAAQPAVKPAPTTPAAKVAPSKAPAPIPAPVPGPAVGAVSTITGAAATTAAAKDKVTPATTKAKDESSEEDDTKTTTSAAEHESSEEDKHDSFGHDHQTHHGDDATISVDVHNILDLFKQELHEVEERIVAAIHHGHDDHEAPKAVPAVKSYRTAAR